MLEAPKSYPEMRKKLLVFNICSFTLLHLLVYADQEKIIENLNFFKTDITNGGKIYFLGSDIQIYFLIPILILAFILDAFQVQKEIETTRRLIDIEYILKALAGRTKAVQGQIYIPQQARCAYIPQVIEDYPALSGGQRFNKALSAAFAARPDILLLDEPTNHLDAANKTALINMLTHFNGTLVIATHDTQLLARLNTLWHIEYGKINIFSGNYADYSESLLNIRANLEDKLNLLEKEKKAAHANLIREQQRAANSKQQGERAKARGKWAPIIAGGKERQAQNTAGGKKRMIAEKKEDISTQIKNLNIREQLKPSFSLPYRQDNATVLFIMEGSAGYGDATVLSGINLSVQGNSRIAICGDNGKGKSTLFKAILNQDLRKGGVWNTPLPQNIGYLDQHYANIAQAQTPLALMASIAPDKTHAEIRKHLNSFLFRSNEEVNAPCQHLSGGERARLSLAAIALRVPKLLLLDEITNNVDIKTKEHIKQILAAYPAALAVISHDEDFIKDIGISEVYTISNGGIGRG